MKKQHTIIIFWSLITILAFCGGYISAQFEPRPLEQVIVDGDEMPGLTDRSKPDTCIAYLDDNKIVHLQYAK